MKTRQRITAITLALCIVLSIAPVFASGVETNVSVIATSGSHSMAITADGVLYGWGANAFSQINAAGTDHLAPVKVLDYIKAVAVGMQHTLALTENGELYAWGGNDFGQVGDGTRFPVYQPKKILTDVMAVAAGYEHSLALKNDGTLWVWGRNKNGQIGDDSRIDAMTPVKVMNDVAYISGGYTHSAAITTSGALYVWGGNANGQIGNGTTMDSMTPVKVMDNIVSVTTGGAHTLAVSADGVLFAWGSNLYGQIGDGTRGGNQLSPLQVMTGVSKAAAGNSILSLAGSGLSPIPSGGFGTSAASDIALISLLLQASGHSLALKTDGTVWAWGSNQYGQLGNQTSIEAMNPVQILSGVIDIAAGSNTSMALKSDGEVCMWGSNNNGQLGDNSRVDRFAPVKSFSGVKTASEPAPADETAEPAPAVQAFPSRDSVELNSASVTFDAYKINGSNYYKLRDIAFALMDISQIPKRFSVEFHESVQTVALTRGGLYQPVGGEMNPGRGENATISPSSHSVRLDGQPLEISGYNIDGSNYFKLRDLMSALDIYVGYDAETGTITLDTSRSYEG